MKNAQMFFDDKRGKFLKKLWCCVGGKYNEIIGFCHLG